MKALRYQATAVNEAAEFIEKGGPMTAPLRKAIQRLVAASAKHDRDARGDECWEHDEGNG